MIENQFEGGKEDFSTYGDYLKRIGLDVEPASLFRPADRIVLQQGNTFDYSYSFENGELLRRRIQNTLFPTVPYEFCDYLEDYGKRKRIDPQLLADALESKNVPNLEVLFSFEPQRLEKLRQALEEDEGLLEKAKDCENEWMNRSCDVEMLYAHTTWGGHIFVTADANFSNTDQGKEK
jgi:hypothetical protein